MDGLDLFEAAERELGEAAVRNAARAQSLTIEGEEVRSTSPEGKERTTSVEELVRIVAGLRATACGMVWPDGVKAALSIPNGIVLVHQTPPRVFSFRWIAPGSQRPFGPGTTYRTIRIGLPYVVVLAVFERGTRGILELSTRNECFFLNGPLDARGLATELCYPALLNCSKLPDGRTTPLAWICTQHLDASEFAGAPDDERSIHLGVRALLRHLLESGFNLSSEHHEVNSWYGESVAARIDERIATVEAWERATAADPLFVLDVPWLPTGKSVADVAGLIAGASTARGARVTTSNDLVRLLFSRPGTRRKS